MRTLQMTLWLGFLTCTVHAAQWPAWRGPTGDGVCTEKGLPLKWGAKENVKWRVALPERGNSTPVVWGKRVFVTQPVNAERMLLCLDRENGRELWRAGVKGAEREPSHGTNPFCSGSAATDGERVIVCFASAGLFCFDMEGVEIWRRDLGLQHHIWGSGPSPVIYGDLCLLNFGPNDKTSLIAFDKKTGKTTWKNDEATGYQHPQGGEKGNQGKTYIGSWTTPVPFKDNDKEALLMSWPGRLCSLDPKTGKENWTSKGLNPLVYTSPLHGDGIAVGMGGFGGMGLAVRTGGKGDVTETHRVWHQRNSPQRIGSGVVHEGHIYIHNDPGTAMCLNLKTGVTVWNERLPAKAGSGTNWSSVMLADGHCYSITQGGECFVFKANTNFELVATNSLGEPSNSSIAASDGELFIRTHRALWCIAQKK